MCISLFNKQKIQPEEPQEYVVVLSPEKIEIGVVSTV